MHSLYNYDFEYDDRNDSDPHAAKVEYNYLYNPDTETYEAYTNHDDFDDYYDNNEPEDDYDDYDDIRFVPPSPHKPKSKRNNKTPKPMTLKKQPFETKVIQPLLESPQPPELPLEILEFVCTHLSQTTLRYGVNRVCKKWHEVSNRFIRRAGIWKPVNGAQELLLQQWSKFDTLELWFNTDPEFMSAYIAGYINHAFWESFAAAITAPTPTELDTQSDNTNDKKSDSSGPSSFLLQTIRHLEMRGKTMGYGDVALKFRGHLQFIESFTITTTQYYTYIPLFTILKDFPSLRSFTVDLPYTTYAQVKHGDDDDLIGDQPEPAINPETAHFPRKPWVIPPPKVFPDRYRLQRFSVSGVGTHLRVLERLLVTCPDLRVFNANNNIVNMHIRQLSVDAERNARHRLIDLAAKHCTLLEWFNFHRLQHTPTDEAHLENIVRTFPNHKFLSMTLGGNQVTTLGNPSSRDILSKITVLDIQPSPYMPQQAHLLNRILCLTPNLLHLHGIKAHFWTGCLWQPPAPVQPAPKLLFNNVRDRKRYERNARREARQQALARYRSTLATTTTNESEMDVNNTLAGDPSTPVTWQVYNLKTLELSLTGGSTMVDFTDYVSRHRLFRNLVTLNLLIPSLKVGQRVNFADPKRSAAITATSSATTTPAPVVAHPPEPERYPNELLALRSLRCLEECILRTMEVPGMVLAKDFEFLRRKEDFQTMSFIPKRRKSTTAKSFTATDPIFTEQSSSASRKNKKRSSSVAGGNEKEILNEDDEYEDDNEDDEGEEQEQERLKTETFWPKLNTFYVYSHKIPPYIWTSKLIEGIEQARPGVAVRFQYRDILLRLELNGVSLPEFAYGAQQFFWRAVSRFEEIEYSGFDQSRQGLNLDVTFSLLKRLIYLTLDGNNMRNHDMRMLKLCRGLTRLRWSRTFEDLLVDAFVPYLEQPAWPLLEDLELESVAHTDEGFSAIFRHVLLMKHLRLNSTTLNRCALDNFECVTLTPCGPCAWTFAGTFRVGWGLMFCRIALTWRISRRGIFRQRIF
ncbi:hypothetical protein KI688_010689 [Linnemannia hyalina]|uniref:F-box domain-containing protein n=1 Tax=Linnemannia hyalina TaxID=64524 RepID=A0A9P7XWI4_9FUNG|nr:hypothetical protein KI688_010689 [Linnemannia hyalina]